MDDRYLRTGIFLAPFHAVRENPTLAIDRDLELLEHLDQAYRRQRRVDFDRRTLPRVLVDHRQASEPSPVRVLPPAAVPAHAEPGLAIQPVYALGVHHEALAPEQHVQPLVADARALAGERLQPGANRRVLQWRGG